MEPNFSRSFQLALIKGFAVAAPIREAGSQPSQTRGVILRDTHPVRCRQMEILVADPARYIAVVGKPALRFVFLQRIRPNPFLKS